MSGNFDNKRKPALLDKLRPEAEEALQNGVGLVIEIGDNLVPVPVCGLLCQRRGYKVIACVAM